jgi:serine/threonine-protein kinase
MIQKNIAGKTVLLKSEHDFSFLDEFDQIFAVFDELISGNICFGAQKNGKKYFLKYAGALPKNYIGSAEQAIQRLKNAEDSYKTLAHKALANLLYTKEYPHGFLMAFDFLYSFPIGPLPVYKKQLRRVPLSMRLAMLDNMFDFFALASRRDYIAANLSDSKFLFDINNASLVLSSINGFIKMPCQNTGRLQGSSIYLPPEAYQFALLDERLTVYSMGVLAMQLLGNISTKSFEDWEADKSLYNITMQALKENRALRQQSAEAFLKSWREAISNMPFSL